MGGRDERVRTTDWEGGEVTILMGGVELDLDEAVPAPGGATLDATVIMGGLDLYVPSGWDVEISATPIMGAVEDNRSRTSPPPGEADRPRLRLTATVIMGGIEISDTRSAGG